MKPKPNIVPEAKLTAHQRASRAFFAEKAGAPVDRWDVVTEDAPGQWLDFADVEAGTFGQARRRADGTWEQAPLGKLPVLLAWKGPVAGKQDA